jgi:CH-like domain in sperm protein
LFKFRKSKEAKVNNFYLVENSLRKLNVRFDGKLIHQIMEEERGASLRLLYQIKLAC